MTDSLCEVFESGFENVGTVYMLCWSWSGTCYVWRLFQTVLLLVMAGCALVSAS